MIQKFIIQGNPRGQGRPRATDTTTITIGGQISSRQLVDIRAILEGTATAHRKPKRQEGGR